LQEKPPVTTTQGGLMNAKQLKHFVSFPNENEKKSLLVLLT
jgi:hypothetical protein